MLFIVGGISIAIGILLEKRTSYLSKLRQTKFGRSFLGSNKAIMFSQMLVLMLLFLLIQLTGISVEQFDIIAGIVVGQLITLALVANGLGKNRS